MNVAIVLPTYNEKENITRMLTALSSEFAKIEKSTIFKMQVLVVDDKSPDGTGKIVESIIKKNKRVSMISGNKNGLGNAYIRGFHYAMNNLKVDVVMEMDADFSHNPKDIKRLLSPLAKGYDFVIGSRYIENGSIPADWSFMRKMNSRFGNIFARYVAGIYHIHDCTAGFRAIKTSLLEQMSLDQLKVEGYSFQMNLLHRALQRDAKIKEVPVDFIDRQYGESKISTSDIIEFVQNAFMLRYLDTKLIVHGILSNGLSRLQRAS